MANPNKLGKDFQIELKENSTWLIMAGAFLIIISLALIASVAEFEYQFFIGLMILAAGLTLVVHSFKFWYKKYIGFFMHLASGLLYSIIGTAIIMEHSIYLNNLLILLLFAYLLSGIFRIKVATTEGLDYLGWGWTFLCGIINIILAVVILALKNKSSPLALIGYVTATDILFTGLAIFWLGYDYYQYRARLPSNRRNQA